MATQVTHDIRISVRVQYTEEQSDPKLGRYLYSYGIRIENKSNRTVQLMRRYWNITDSLADQREVAGPGVVGETPVLAPGEQFTYTSYCDLKSSAGRMQGFYLMRHTDDGTTFEVPIPAFELLYPFAAN